METAMRGVQSTGRALGVLVAVGGLFGCASESERDSVSYACAVPVEDAPTRGDKDSWVTIVEFADFQCPYCQRAQATIDEVKELRPDVRWAFKHFPITSSHKYAEQAASAADCAHQQGEFWAMHDRLFSEAGVALTTTALTSYAEKLGLDMEAWESCFRSDESLERISADFNQGLKYGVEGTPAFFINGYLLPGSYPTSDFLRVIDLATDEAKESGEKPDDYYQTLVERGCGD